MLNHFEGLNLSLTALKISHLEQLNNEIFALLSTRFNCLKIDYLIKRVGITKHKKAQQMLGKGSSDRPRGFSLSIRR
ncbi:hypothetical protein EVU92_08775 [Pseudoalteromonas sp. MEBiC 03485]|nr:hypothetical protein EVU92_08775 [Pseudoalteromonas sp. MEBiC 03485]